MAWNGKCINTLTVGSKSEIEFLNEISGKLVNEIIEVISKYEIPVAKVTEEYGKS